MKFVIYLICSLVCAVSAAQTGNRINYDESKVPQYELPEILVDNSGRKICTVRDWETIRRPEILRIFGEQMYGLTPSYRIDTKWTVLSGHDDALDGKATFKQVLFSFSNGEKTVEAVLLLITPNAFKGRLPVFVSYNYNGNHSLCDDTRLCKSEKLGLLKPFGDPAWERASQKEMWPLEQFLDRGYAVATMCYHDICPDREELREHGVAALFPGFHKRMQDCNEWGAIGVWAWGLSRIADYLETDERIDSGRMVVMGHSRQGKVALWAGAQDERFKVVISNDSGCGGAALSKRVYGENLAWITSYLGYWFCPAFRQYAANEEALPFDQHQLLACIAPRHLYVASADNDRWCDPKGEYLSAYYAGEVYRLYGMRGLDSPEMPAVHEPVHNDVGYHLRSGKHDITPYDISCYLDYCDKYLK